MHNLKPMRILMMVWIILLAGPILSAQPKSDSAPQSPAPRYGHQMMTYDEGSKRVLLFGRAGQNASYGDLWAWDGRGWTLLSATGPAPRDSGVFVYDAWRKRTVLYEGRDRNSPLWDTLEWDGKQWR